MEKTNTRVLAYQLAQVIPDESLHQISGGNGANMTTQRTLKITGQLESTDAAIDFSVDF